MFFAIEKKTSPCQARAQGGPMLPSMSWERADDAGLGAGPVASHKTGHLVPGITHDPLASPVLWRILLARQRGRSRRIAPLVLGARAPRLGPPTAEEGNATQGAWCRANPPSLGLSDRTANTRGDR